MTLKWKRLSDPKGTESEFVADTNLVATNLRVTYPRIFLKVTSRGGKWYFGAWQRYQTYNIPFINSIVPFKSMRDAKAAAVKELESLCKALQS